MDNPRSGSAYWGAGSWTEAKTTVENVAGRLREVTVRPAVGSGEKQRWNALMSAHYYLPFRGLVGRSCDLPRIR